MFPYKIVYEFLDVPYLPRSAGGFGTTDPRLSLAPRPSQPWDSVHPPPQEIGHSGHVIGNINHLYETPIVEMLMTLIIGILG